MRKMLFLLFFTLLLVVTSVFVNQYIIKNRLMELNQLLYHESLSRRGHQTFNIVGKLELIRKRIESGENPIENYKLEAKLQSLASDFHIVLTEKEEEQPESPKLFVLIKKILGKSQEEKGLPPEYFSLVEEAFFWERNRLYKQAIESYQYVLDQSNSSIPLNLLETIQIHMAFSQIMSADYFEARRNSLDLSQNGSSKEVVDASRTILNFITFIEIRNTKLQTYADGTLEKGREQYYSAQYESALENIKAFLKNNSDKSQNIEARYFKGRAHEELGQSREAVSEFQRISFLDKNSSWSKESNRRLLMLFSFYDSGLEKSETVKKILEDFDDPEIIKTLESFTGLYNAQEPEEIVSEGSPDRTLFSAPPQSTTADIYVTTDPVGAQIYVNGITLDISPILITDIPFGTVNIRANLEGAVFEKSITVKEPGIHSAFLKLPSLYGKLKILNPLQESTVYLDDQIAGEIDKIDLNRIPSGDYILTITGKDSLDKTIFWENPVTIIAGETLTVSMPE